MDTIEFKQTKLYKKLDDDGKLYMRYINKTHNAKKEGLISELTFEQYCRKVDEAGLVSSDLGFSNNNKDKYVLARYNDTGNYTVDSCRFITQSQNMKERKISDKNRIASSNNMKKYNESIKELPAEEKAAYYNKIAETIAKTRGIEINSKEAIITNNNTIKYRRKYDYEKERSYKKYAVIYINRTGERNSSYGTFWITNGTDNKKWKDDKGPIPEGYYKGRVCNNK